MLRFRSSGSGGDSILPWLSSGGTRTTCSPVASSWVWVQPPPISEVRPNLRGQQWDLDPTRPDDSPLLQGAVYLGVQLLALTDACERHPEWDVVSHEDLCLEPVAGLRAVAERLRLEWTSASEAFVRTSNQHDSGYTTRRIAEAQPNRWRDRLRPEHVATIDAALARFPERVVVRHRRVCYTLVSKNDEAILV